MLVDRKKLLETLKTVLPGVSKKDTVEQGKCFVFSSGSLMSFNDGMAVICPCDYPVEGAVAAAEFHGILKHLKAAEVDLSESDGRLVVGTGATRSRISLEKDIRLPLDTIPAAEEWFPLPQNFVHAMTLCSKVCKQDTCGSLVSYVLVDGGFMVAGDGLRMLCHGLSGGMPRFLVPGDAAALLASYNPVEMSVAPGWLLFRNKDAVLFGCRTVDPMEPYPFVPGDVEPGDGQHSVERLLAFQGSVLKFPDNLAAALEECRVITKGCKGDERVELSCGKGHVIVTGFSDVAEHKHRFPVEGMPDFHVIVSPVALLDALKLGAVFTLGHDAMKIEVPDYRVWMALLDS